MKWETENENEKWKTEKWKWKCGNNNNIHNFQQVEMQSYYSHALSDI